MRKRIALAVAAFVLVAALLLARKFVPLGRLGTGYAAELTCACVFVSGRTLDSCRGDLDPLAQKLVSVTVGKGEVRTSAIGVLRARATWSAPTGCTLVE
jgi:hypothetical protein